MKERIQTDNAGNAYLGIYLDPGEGIKGLLIPEKRAEHTFDISQKTERNRALVRERRANGKVKGQPEEPRTA